MPRVLLRSFASNPTNLFRHGRLVLLARRLFLSEISWLQAVEVQTMADTSKYQCNVCGYIYDPAEGDPSNGVQPETAFSELPEG
jgi:hypothetical protein